MDQFAPTQLKFEDGSNLHELPHTNEQFVVDLAGFEGPLDLLLNMAKLQKVDLTRISILALAEQYLLFINTARQLRLELAADYLVMAAWLAYLKSRLILPEQEDEEEPTAQELADELAFRLKRLESMREAAAKLMDRNRLGSDVLQRGSPEPVIVSKTREWKVSLYDLLTSYAASRQRTSFSQYTLKQRKVWSLKDARKILTNLLGNSTGWVSIDSFLVQYLSLPEESSTIRASSFSASLELVKEGIAELRQASAFATLYIKPKKLSSRSEG